MSYRTTAQINRGDPYFHTEAKKRTHFLTNLRVAEVVRTYDSKTFTNGSQGQAIGPNSSAGE